MKLRRSEGRHHGISFPRSKICTSAFTQALTSYAYTLRQQKLRWKSFTKESVAVTLEESLYHTILLLRGIDGLACRNLLKNLLICVTNATGMP